MRTTSPAVQMQDSSQDWVSKGGDYLRDSLKGDLGEYQFLTVKTDLSIFLCSRLKITERVADIQML
jgi:hypothetical protein